MTGNKAVKPRKVTSRKKADWGRDRWNNENGFGNDESEVFLDK